MKLNTTKKYWFKDPKTKEVDVPLAELIVQLTDKILPFTSELTINNFSAETAEIRLTQVNGFFCKRTFTITGTPEEIKLLGETIQVYTRRHPLLKKEGRRR